MTTIKKLRKIFEPVNIEQAITDMDEYLTTMDPISVLVARAFNLDGGRK